MVVISSDKVYSIARNDEGYHAMVRVPLKCGLSNLCIDSSGNHSFTPTPCSTVEQAEQLIQIHRNGGVDMTETDNTDLIPNEDEVKTPEQPKKKKGKKNKPVAEAKPAKKKTVSTPSEKRPGVISCMIEMLRAADSKNPVTKAEILAELCTRFPERTESAMKSTLNMQVPSGLRTEKGLEVSSASTDNGKGYWLTPDQLTRKERAEQPAAEVKPAKKTGKKKAKKVKVSAE
jgi:hypothetical protein